MIVFEVLTLFPGMLEAPLSASLLGKARSAGLIEVRIRDIREYATGKHRVCDDTPYGGGAGMVMKPEPVVAAIEAARAESMATARVLLLSPRGNVLKQEKVRALAAEEHLVLVCGRYEGVDERVRQFVDEEISIGDFVLSGGEPAAWIIVDAVARLIPGVVGNEASITADSFSDGLLEHPHYTRPQSFRGLEVPSILMSGDHAKVARWRRRQALLRTRDSRPDLFSKLSLSEADRLLLSEDETK